MFHSLNEMIVQRSLSDLTLELVRGSTDRTHLRLADLHDRASRRLGLLRVSGLGQGDRLVIYVYDEALFLELFWAAVLGGIVPVPIAPGNSPDHKTKLLAVCDVLPDARVVAESDALERLDPTARAQLAQRLLPHSILEGSEPLAAPVQVGRDEVAFIQFSSGSTRTPKGIVLTHGNLLDNLDDLAPAFGLKPGAVALSWMPLTHDMGIIGFHLCPIYAGCDHVLMRTALFVRRPLLWLQLVSEFRATTLGSPNFGFRHWLNAQRTGGGDLPDLSCVRQIINGAEPINQAASEAFMAELEPAGLSSDAMCPSYGLAEASLGVSVSPPRAGARWVRVRPDGLRFGEPVQFAGAEDTTAITFACNGVPLPRCRVRIATETGVDLGVDHLGEIQISGGNVTSGYASVSGEDSGLFAADGWLRTGDLGFLHDGEVVVTGRLKDMIVLEGRNYFAPDVEMLIEEQGLAEAGEVAAAALPGTGAHPQEAFALFLRERQPGPDFAQRAEATREAVFSAMGLTLAGVVPVRSLPKTTSGKIQRGALARAYLDGEFEATLALVEEPVPDAAASGEPGTALPASDFVLARLKSLMESEALDAARIDERTNFFEMGITSPMLAALTEEINGRYPGVLDVTDFFEHGSVSEIASEIEQRLRSAAVACE